jgi:hypothetical protein
MAKISLFVLNKITLAFATYSIYSGYYWWAYGLDPDPIVLQQTWGCSCLSNTVISYPLDIRTQQGDYGQMILTKMPKTHIWTRTLQ